MVDLGLISTFCPPYSDNLFIHIIPRGFRDLRWIKFFKVGGLITPGRVARQNTGCIIKF